MKICSRLTQEEAEILGLQKKQNEKGRQSARYYITIDQKEVVLEYRHKINKRQFVETLRKIGKDGSVVSSVEKLQSEPIAPPEGFEVVKVSTSQTTGQQWVQYAKKKEDTIEEFDFESIIKKHIKPIAIKRAKNQSKEYDFDTLTYTDVHVGMETDKDLNSMYPVEWNALEVLKMAQIIIDKTVEEQSSNTLYIDELGDLLDGLNAKTTRGGHELPQNMTNEEAFDCALSFKMDLIDGLVPYYDEVICNNICNDNHAGSFGYFVNKAFKEISELKYKNVKVTNHRQFINHYFVGDVCFVISHGKDDKTLKFGFKPKLDSQGLEKIDQYCKQMNIYKKAKQIIFKKGDSHQAIFDMATSDDFYYFNYPALSPSSQWVQNNFKKGRRGFFIESYKGLDVTMKPVFL